MFTVKQLRYFVAIVEHGSFSEAAEQLFIAQSALSRQIRDMEARLQVRLLDREARSVVPTPAGQAMYEAARRLLGGMADAATQVRKVARGLSGTVRVLHSSSVPLLPAWLAAMQAHLVAHPGVTVEVSQASSEQQARDIADGSADVGLARAPILRSDPRVLRQRLLVEPLLVAVPAAHPLAARAAVTLAELAGEAFVSVPHRERGGLSRCVADLCQQRGFYPHGARVTSRKWSQLALVGHGFGIAVLPASMARDRPPGVAAVPLADADCRSEVLLLRRRDGDPSGEALAAALLAASANAAADVAQPGASWGGAREPVI